MVEPIHFFLQLPVAATVLMGNSLVISFVNDKAVELLNKRREEISGIPLLDVFPDWRNSELEQKLQTLMGQKVNSCSVGNICSGNLSLNFECSPLYTNADKIEGVICTFYKMQELGKTEPGTGCMDERSIKEEAQNAMINELARSNDELQQFVYVASHDLQEPLRKISFYIDMIYGKMPHDSVRTLLQKVDDSSKRMRELVKSLLDYAKLSNDGTRFTKVDLTAVIEVILTDYEVLIEQKKATFEIEGMDTIEALALQMNQLFFNLVGNALKFTKRNVRPVITIKGQMLSPEKKKAFGFLQQHKDYIEITVKDNGIGFSQEYAQRIFTVFQRLNERSTYGGYGIGLALCKKVAETHHGYIYAEARLGEGASFITLLPYQQ